MSVAFPMRPGSEPILQHYLNAVQSAITAGDAAGASRISAEAAERGIEHPGMLALAVYHYLDHARINMALRYAARARELAPRQADVLNAFGQTLVQLGRQGEAVKAFDEALRQSPSSFVSHFNKANALVEMSRLKQARDHFIRAHALNSAHAETITHLAHIAAQQGDAEEARRYGQRALGADSGQIHAYFAVARADILEGKFESALDVLRSRSRDKMRPAIAATLQSLMGDALDGLQRYDEAFEAYHDAAELFRAAYAPIYARPGQVRALDLTRKLERYFRNAPMVAWQNVDAGSFQSPVAQHVFLLGFPRSGTTLLGQVLSSHPMIETMEECSCLDDAHPFVLEEGGLDQLAALDGAALDHYREAYWRRVAEAGAVPSRPVFIDKLPLNSVLLCLVAKLFPDAKVLFAVRDPRDVVFSCFRRQFGMNAQMYELNTLESTAIYYDAVQRLCDIYQDMLPLDITFARHEDLVANFAQEAQRLCAFLGLEYDARMQQFASRAKAKFIDTPSAAQVARGLYPDAQSKWRSYRSEMAPILANLSDWVSRYGYPAD
jgi:tetratricopeptide (TPR) repeat protein